MIRRRNLWCVIRGSAKRSLPRVHVTHPHSRVSITPAFPMSERGSLHIVQPPLKLCAACPCESDPSFISWYIVDACIDKTAQIQNGVACTSGLLV